MLFARIQPVNDCVPPDFGCAEHLLLWACRRSRLGVPFSLDLAEEFVDTCGEDGIEVLFALDLFVQAIASTTLRRPEFGEPVAHTLTEDERLLVTLLAACQAGLPDIAQHCLDQLVDTKCRSFVMMAAGTLAKAFAINALDLHIPADHARDRCPQSAIAA